MRRPRPYILALLAIALLTVPFVAGAGDAVLDAKRSAAAKLFKDGKTADAQKLYEEIIAQDQTVWSDHYALAKIYDKAGETPKAVEAYHRVIKILKNNAKASPERTALSDSEKRLDALDQTTKKVEQAFGDFARSLEALAKDAEKAKNPHLLERIRIMQRALAQAGTTGIAFSVKVPANIAAVDTGLDLEIGDTVQLAAKGSWSTKGGDATFESGPDGLKSTAPGTGLPTGMLLARIGLDGQIQGVGASAEIRAEAAGRLYLLVNDAGKADNTGAMDVWIRRK